MLCRKHNIIPLHYTQAGELGFFSSLAPCSPCKIEVSLVERPKHIDARQEASLISTAGFFFFFVVTNENDVIQQVTFSLSFLKCMCVLCKCALSTILNSKTFHLAWKYLTPSHAEQFSASL